VLARGARLACLGLLVSSAAAADEYVLALEPGATEIRFRVAATLHTVAGAARLEGGTIYFDPDAGTASGEIVVDARSLETGNARRDRVMHGKVLESGTFPEIVFIPERFEGSLADSGASQARLHGELRLHGAVHLAVITAEIQAQEDRLSVTARFSVPYVALGLEDPSKLLLRVAKQAEIEIRFTAPFPGSLSR
jgi:polyisoprenoid-binding protein YceI